MKVLAESVGAAALISLGFVPGASGHALRKGSVGSSLDGRAAALASPNTTAKVGGRPGRPLKTSTVGGRRTHRDLLSSDKNGLVTSDDALDVNGSVSVSV